MPLPRLQAQPELPWPVSASRLGTLGDGRVKDSRHCHLSDEFFFFFFNDRRADYHLIFDPNYRFRFCVKKSGKNGAGGDRTAGTAPWLPTQGGDECLI